MQDTSNKRTTKRLYETRFSFGAASGIITTLGLIVGLDTWTHAKAGIIGGILVMAVADNISDSMGIHVFQESECLDSKEVWFSTFSNFFARILVSTSFILPIVFFPLKTAVVLSIIWGLLLLSFLTYLVAKDRKVNPAIAILEHIAIAIAVIVLSKVVGKWIFAKF